MVDIWMDVDTAVTVPVNILPLIALSDFKTVLDAETYNEAGLELIWNFVTAAGVQTHVAVTPTDTGGSYDWVNVGHGMYNIEIPASGGASANNDTEGFGWFTGKATDALPWRGPVIGFRAAALNNLLIEDAFSTTRGLAGTALPAAAADAAGGLPVSDAGGLDLDTYIKRIETSITAAILARIDENISAAKVLAASQPNYAPAKPGDAMTLTAAYDAAKSAAPAGAEMDLVAAPNATAIAAIQSGLATPGDITTAHGTTDGKIDSLNDISAADVNAQCDQALLDYDAPTKAEMDDGLDLLPTAVEIRTEMDSNSTKLINLDAQVSTRSSHSAADVWAVGTRTLTGFGTLVADIWTNASRTLTEKTGFALTAAYDPAKTAAQASDITTAHSTTDGKIDAIQADVDAILADTDEVQAELADGGRLDLLIDAIKAKTDLIVLNDIADAILKRDWSAVTGEASRSLLNMGRVIRNKVAPIEGGFSVKKEDDSTEAFQIAVTTDAEAVPITGTDPT